MTVSISISYITHKATDFNFLFFTVHTFFSKKLFFIKFQNILSNSFLNILSIRLFIYFQLPLWFLVIFYLYK